MKANGSVYVAAVFAALIGYFVYQWWFNPNRMIKAKLGEVAANLSAPDDESAAARAARLLRLRNLAINDIYVKIGDEGGVFTSRDALLGAIAALPSPPGGRNVDFGDVDVRVSGEDTATAFVTADISARNPQTGEQTLDSRDVTFSFVKQNGEWLVREAEAKALRK